MNIFQILKIHAYFFCKRIVYGGRYILIDYPVYPKPHWGKCHPILDRIISFNKDAYLSLLQSFIPLCDDLSHSPAWKIPKNHYFGGLDAVVLYGFISTVKPEKYVEIGSGFSTAFAASAKKDHSPNTQIICIDPHPRANIQPYCDLFVHERLEDMDLSFFSTLQNGDILFIDNSHRVFTNSDVTTLFFDVFPYLHEGVLIEMHDICLPQDYPEEWNNRFYSEQYLIGAYILGGYMGMEIVMPNAYMIQNNQIPEEIKKFGLHGVSFWFRKTKSDDFTSK